jgi:hypothetical protein
MRLIIKKRVKEEETKDEEREKNIRGEGRKEKRELEGRE